MPVRYLSLLISKSLYSSLIVCNMNVKVDIAHGKFLYVAIYHFIFFIQIPAALFLGSLQARGDFFLFSSSLLRLWHLLQVRGSHRHNVRQVFGVRGIFFHTLLFYIQIVHRFWTAVHFKVLVEFAKIFEKLRWLEMAKMGKFQIGKV